KLGIDGSFTRIADMPCCGSVGIAFDGAKVYFTARVPGMTNPALNTIDVTTGEVGIPVELTGNPSLHIEELRFFHGTLYAASRYGRLLTIDPTTGVTTLVNTAAYANAMEVFE